MLSQFFSNQKFHVFVFFCFLILIKCLNILRDKIKTPYFYCLSESRVDQGSEIQQPFLSVSFQKTRYCLHHTVLNACSFFFWFHHSTSCHFCYETDVLTVCYFSTLRFFFCGIRFSSLQTTNETTTNCFISAGIQYSYLQQSDFLAY